MSRIIRALIDSAALQHNLHRVREIVGAGKRVMAVVKANAYGHGLAPAALALRAADALAVARLDEGLQLRAAGIRQPIVLLEGVFSLAELAIAAQADFELVVHDPEQIVLLETAALEHRFALWVKADTGMHRLGFRPEAYLDAWCRLQRLKYSPAILRAMTHLASADEPTAPQTAAQLATFSRLTAQLNAETSIGNSAGCLLWPDGRGDWVRPGLALYGVSPLANKTGYDFGLKPAMRLESTVIATKIVRAGETVGYGGTWRAARDTPIAIVAAGYGDGLPRSLASGAPVWVAGQTARLAGRVSMDMIAIDLTSLTGVQVGSRVELWGPQQPVEILAQHAGTVPYELLCGVSQRVPLELG
jgi:alanine racemase